MKENKCICAAEQRELCPVHKVRTRQKDFYKYEEDYLTQEDNNANDDI